MLRILSVLVLFIATANAIAGDSPQFRGIDGQGHSDETNLPVTWSETENIRWKSNLPGLGWSTPSIVGNQIWLTTAIDEGKSLHVIRIDRDSGAITHDQEIFHHDEPLQSLHAAMSLPTSKYCQTKLRDIFMMFFLIFGNKL